MKSNPLRFVLVRPRNPLNIGAAARAMANFGFSEMVVVKPFSPTWRETKSAVGGDPVMRAARAVASIEEAIQDCAVVVGTTALRDRHRDRPVVSLPDLAGYLKKNHPDVAAGRARAALLFGPEKTGLANAYLERCQFWLTIPTHPLCPSMNLGQSVALCSYEWARALSAFTPLPWAPNRSPLATIDDRRRLAAQAAKVCAQAGFLPFLSDGEKVKTIRQRLLHWRLHKQDVALMHGLFRFLLKTPPRKQ